MASRKTKLDVEFKPAFKRKKRPTTSRATRKAALEIATQLVNSEFTFTVPDLIKAAREIEDYITKGSDVTKSPTLPFATKKVP